MNKKHVLIGVAIGVALLLLIQTILSSFLGTKTVAVDTGAQTQKIESYSSLITPATLSSLIGNEDVVVIGSVDPKKATSGVIEGSYRVWRGDYSADAGEYPFGGMRASKEKMESLLSSMGVKPTDTIVVYAQNSHHDATRLWWQIHEVLGHEKVYVLDGGINAWQGALAQPLKADKNSGYKAPNYSENTVATLDMVVDAVNSEQWVIIDTRGSDEFDGSSTKSGAAGPGAVESAPHINWTNAQKEDTTLKSKTELEALYSQFAGKKVITFCQSGVRSAHTMFVLKEILGVDEVYNYDGSWIELSYEFYENGNSSLPLINTN